MNFFFLQKNKIFISSGEKFLNLKYFSSLAISLFLSNIPLIYFSLFIYSRKNRIKLKKFTFETVNRSSFFLHIFIRIFLNEFLKILIETKIFKFITLNKDVLFDEHSLQFFEWAVRVQSKGIKNSISSRFSSLYRLRVIPGHSKVM